MPGVDKSKNVMITGVVAVGLILITTFLLNSWINKQVEKSDEPAISSSTMNHVPASLPVMSSSNSVAASSPAADRDAATFSPQKTQKPQNGSKEIIYEIPQKNVILVQ